MLKAEYIRVSGLEEAIRGMRNPMNSWDKSDSTDNPCELSPGENCDECMYVVPTESGRNACGLTVQDKWSKLRDEFYLGPKDLELGKKLAMAGPVHGKFLRMIDVSMDITAPLYWWKEFDTYKVGTVANSCSTMHKIHAKEFTLSDFSTEHLISVRSSEADNFGDDVLPMTMMEWEIDLLNKCRELYLAEKDGARAKMFWWQLIQLLPSSYNQRRTVKFNYEVVRNMIQNRSTHKLDEWQFFCGILRGLPYVYELGLCDGLTQ